MTNRRGTPLLPILQAHFNPREEGWAWLELSAHDREGAVVNQIEGEYDDPGAAAASLAHLVRDVGADAALLAICRWDGRPTERDRELWRALRTELRRGQLDDMVVFNDRDAWSMREEDAAHEGKATAN